MNRMHLSKNFKLTEFVDKQDWEDGEIGDYQIENAKLLCKNVLQPLRDYLNLPIIITSGIRSYWTNLKANGVNNSQHLEGKAADFSCIDPLLAFNFLHDNIEFDQLIIYLNDKNDVRFFHVSYNQRANRNQILLCKNIFNQKSYFNYNKETHAYIRWKTAVK